MIKSYLFLRYLGIILIAIAFIVYPFTDDLGLHCGCIMFTLIGMYALVASSANKKRFFPND